MLQSRGLRADTRGVNEVVLRRIAVIKSSVVFNLKIARVTFSFVLEKRKLTLKGLKISLYSGSGTMKSNKNQTRELDFFIKDIQ